MNKNIFSIIVILIILSGTVLAECPNDPDCPDFDWQNADYSNIDWNTVDLSNPDIVWENVDQSMITGNKVSEIPKEHFDPNQVQKSDLKYANSEQIKEHISEFENLADANHIEVKKVFLEVYDAELDIEGANNIKFDSWTGKVTGDFPAYDPRQYPKDKYKQFIIGDKVKIVSIVDSGTEEDNFMEISGAQEFTMNQDGTFSVIADPDKDVVISGQKNNNPESSSLSKGQITLPDGSVAHFSNQGTFRVKPNGDLTGENVELSIERDGKIIKKIDGKFQKLGDSVVIESYSGRHSTFEDTESDLKVKSVGYPILVLREDAKNSVNGMNNVVFYSDKKLVTRGAVDVNNKGMHITSKDKKSTFYYENGATTALGRINVEDKSMAYSGLTDTSFLVREFQGHNEFIRINGADDGEIAKLSRKITVGSLDGNKLNERTIELTSVISQEDGVTKLSNLQSLMSSIKNIQDNDYMLIEKNLLLELGDKDAYFGISPRFGMRYESKQGDAVNIISPENTQIYLGDKVNPNDIKLHDFLQDNSKLIAKNELGTFQTKLEGFISGSEGDVSNAKLLLANIYLKNGNLDEVRRIYGEIIRENPDNKQASALKTWVNEYDTMKSPVSDALRRAKIEFDIADSEKDKKTIFGFGEGKDIQLFTEEEIKQGKNTPYEITKRTLSLLYSSGNLVKSSNEATKGLPWNPSDIGGGDEEVKYRANAAAADLIIEYIDSGEADTISGALELIRSEGEKYTSYPDGAGGDLRYAQVYQEISNNPTIIAAIEAEKLQKDTNQLSQNQIDKINIQMAKAYREKGMYLEALGILKPIYDRGAKNTLGGLETYEKHASNEEKEAFELIDQITGKGYRISDATKSLASLETAGDFGNVFMLAGYGIAIKGGGAVIGMTKTGQQLLKATSLAKGALGSGVGARIVSELAWEGVESAVGYINPSLEVVAMALDGGPDADYYAKQALKDIEFRQTGKFHLAEGEVSQVVTVSDSSLDEISKLKNAEKIDGGFKITDEQGHTFHVYGENIDLAKSSFVDIATAKEDIQSLAQKAEIQQRFDEARSAIDSDIPDASKDFFKNFDSSETRILEASGRLDPPTLKKMSKGLTIDEEMARKNPAYLEMVILDVEMINDDVELCKKTIILNSDHHGANVKIGETATEVQYKVNEYFGYEGTIDEMPHEIRAHKKGEDLPTFIAENQGTPMIIVDHLDVDSINSVITAKYPKFAKEHKDLLTRASGFGDTLDTRLVGEAELNFYRIENEIIEEEAKRLKKTRYQLDSSEMTTVLIASKDRIMKAAKIYEHNPEDPYLRQLIESAKMQEERQLNSIKSKIFSSSIGRTIDDVIQGNNKIAISSEQNLAIVKSGGYDPISFYKVLEEIGEKPAVIIRYSGKKGSLKGVLGQLKDNNGKALKLADRIGWCINPGVRERTQINVGGLVAMLNKLELERRLEILKANIPQSNPKFKDFAQQIRQEIEVSHWGGQLNAGGQPRGGTVLSPEEVLNLVDKFTTFLPEAATSIH